MTHVSKLIHFGQYLPRHIPQLYLLYQQGILTSSGYGQVVIWDSHERIIKGQSVIPIAVLYMSITQASGKLISMCMGNYLQKSRKKLITFHQDLKIRVWNLQEKACINISQPKTKFLNITKIQSCNQRTIILAGQKSVQLFDIVKMHLLCSLQFNSPLQDLSSIIVKYDDRFILKYGFRQVEYKINFSQKQILHLNSLLNYQDSPLNTTLIKGKQLVKEYIIKLKQQIPTIFNLRLLQKDFLTKYYKTLKQFLSQQINCSSVSFLQNQMYHFYGFKSGLLLGIPAFYLPQKNTLILYHRKADDNQLAFIRFFDSLLILSSQIGKIHIFDFKNHRQLLKKIPQDSQQIQTFLVGIDKLMIYSGLFSRPIAYPLTMLNYCDQTNPYLTFLLDNKQIVIYNKTSRAAFSINITHISAHIYCIGILKQSTFVVFTSHSVQIVSSIEGVIRDIDYQVAKWSNFINYSHLQQDHPSTANICIKQNHFVVRWLKHQVNYYDCRSKRKMDMLKSELWGWTNPQECNKRAAKEGQYNVHVNNLFVGISKQVSAIVLQLRLDNRKAQLCQNISHIVQYNSVQFSKRLSQKKVSYPCFMHLLNCKNYHFKQYLKDWHLVIREHPVHKSIGTSFSVILKQKQKFPPLLTLDTLQYCNFYWKNQTNSQKATKILIQTVFNQVHNDIQLDPLLTACLSIHNEGSVSQCALNILAALYKQKSDKIPIFQLSIQERDIDLMTLAKWILNLYKYLHNPRSFPFLSYLQNNINVITMQSYTSQFCLLLKILSQHFIILSKLQPQFNWNTFVANLLTLFFFVQVRNQLQHFQNDPSLSNYDLKLPQLCYQDQSRINLLITRAICQILGQKLSDLNSLLSNSLQNTIIHPLYPRCTITLVERLLKKKIDDCNHHRMFFAGLLVKCLDPSNPILRKWCRLPALRAIQTLSQYDEIAYCQKSQKLAVFQDGSISFFDLRSAVKWKVQQADYVKSMAFSPNGRFIAAYQPKINQVTVWKVGAPGLWGGLSWLQGKQKVSLHVQRTIQQPSCQLRWKDDDRQVALVSGVDVINFKF